MLHFHEALFPIAGEGLMVLGGAVGTEGALMRTHNKFVETICHESGRAGFQPGWNLGSSMRRPLQRVVVRDLLGPSGTC